MAIEILGRVAHFRKLPQEELRRLAAGFIEQRHGAGETVYEAGDPVRAFYIVADGAVLILPAGGTDARPEARLVCGDVFGATDLFDRQHHSETARTEAESLILSAPRDHLLSVLEGQPLVELNLRLAAARSHTQRARAALHVARRRAVRRRINRAVQLTTEEGEAGRATLVDLSTLGMCLQDAPEQWRLDTIARCRLSWGDRRLDIAGRIIWRDGSTVGMEFREPSPDQQASIREAASEMLASAP